MVRGSTESGARMSVRIRFRSDSWWIAQCKFKGTVHADYMASSRDEWDAVPPPQPGDIWRSHWHGDEHALAGYAICCPKCGDVHTWTTATNCSFQTTEHTY